TGTYRCDLYRYEIRPENYTSSSAYEASIQNFANWFSFYGNRARSMIGAMTRSFSDLRDMRVGYFTINGDKPDKLPMYDLTVQADKNTLYGLMLGLGASGQTPNRQAVDYIGKQFIRNDGEAPIQSQCQKNSGM